MTTLLARILLSILMLPLAAMCWFVIFISIAGTIREEEAGLVIATLATAMLVSLYWIMLWRRSVVWSSSRLTRTVLASVGCVVAGVLAGVMLMGVTPIHEPEIGVFFGGVFATVLWLPVTVLIWRETAAERAERVRHAAGDVVFCPRCGYNMTGLYEPRCPECGAKFTLSQLYAAQKRDEIADAERRSGPKAEHDAGTRRQP